jgi:hypothetical protein
MDGSMLRAAALALTADLYEIAFSVHTRMPLVLASAPVSPVSPVSGPLYD